MRECVDCGFPLEAMELSACPKCDHDLGPRRVVELGILEVDIAHAGETWEQAKDKIDRAFDDAIYYRHAGLKIIHGYGSRTGISVIGPRARSYMRHLVEKTEGARFASDRHTEGASIIWLNR
ncbi:MAG: hypothetical protein ACN4GG_00575 [Akkermansiaceae bacterium]